jgi:phosphate transport system ATP-binding protein
MTDSPSPPASKPARLRRKTGEKPAGNRLEAIAKGATFDSVIHKAVLAEDPIVEVQDFNLWYGPSRPCSTSTCGSPATKVTAIIGPSGCGKSTSSAASTG